MAGAALYPALLSDVTRTCGFPVHRTDIPHHPNTESAGAPLVEAVVDGVVVPHETSLASISDRLIKCQNSACPNRLAWPPGTLMP